jgi:protein-L-isoaspartate(D-aspartate) O-methyltransferase
MDLNEMVRVQIQARGVKNPAVLDAMRRVDRRLFVPPDMREHALEDRPLPIGADQTISQPYIVGLMTELLEPTPNSRVLEIGTGCGYQTAILAELADQVYSVEIVESLAKSAATLLGRLGYANVHTRVGDGHAGWPEEAPFDGILVTAAPVRTPRPLLDQLRHGGRLVVPVGPGDNQRLKVFVKKTDGVVEKDILAVRFVPMTGGAMEERGDPCRFTDDRLSGQKKDRSDESD